MQITIQVRFAYNEITEAMERVGCIASGLEGFKIGSVELGRNGHIVFDFVRVDELPDAEEVRG